jgi:filamentous hemagglutinin
MTQSRSLASRLCLLALSACLVVQNLAWAAGSLSGSLDKKEAMALIGENKGLIYVYENQGGTSAAQKAAQEFQAGTSGSFSDLVTGKQVVPALRYDNPNAGGLDFIKFDGIETAADGSTVLLIDAKTKLAIWSRTTQNTVLETLKRVEAAVAQNPGYKVVYEFPNAKAMAEAQTFIKQSQYRDVVTVRVRGQ